MILVNKSNFSLKISEKAHNSNSLPKSTFYTDFKICLALEGDAVWEIEDFSYKIKPGDIILLNMGQKRKLTSFGKNGFKLCAITISRNAFEGQHHFMFFQNLIKNYGNLIQKPLLSGIIKEIYEEWGSKSPLFYEFASAKLTEFFIKTEREYNFNVFNVSENYRRMRYVLALIDENLCNEISLKSVGKQVGLSESTLSRQFSEINGISFKDYVVEKRVQKAINLLNTTNKKVIDIALECGFESISGFYTAFKKKTGTTPGKFFEQDI